MTVFNYTVPYCFSQGPPAAMVQAERPEGRGAARRTAARPDLLDAATPSPGRRAPLTRRSRAAPAAPLALCHRDVIAPLRRRP